MRRLNLLVIFWCLSSMPMVSINPHHPQKTLGRQGHVLSFPLRRIALRVPGKGLCRDSHVVFIRLGIATALLIAPMLGYLHAMWVWSHWAFDGLVRTLNLRVRSIMIYRLPFRLKDKDFRVRGLQVYSKRTCMIWPFWFYQVVARLAGIHPFIAWFELWLTFRERVWRGIVPILRALNVSLMIFYSHCPHCIHSQ
jgi:hypothetical protein